jgi:hypothetical protein
MTDQYKPRQRTVSATVLTTAGWLTCNFHVLEKATLLEQIDSVEEFYKVTDASVVGVDTTVEFLALQRDAIELIVPTNEPDGLLAATMPKSQTDEVFVLFDQGVLQGSLRWLENVRLSDFVKRQDGFILLRDCTIRLGHVLEGDFRVEEAPAALVNVNHIVGISETPPW